jgi:hypothetical protein
VTESSIIEEVSSAGVSCTTFGSSISDSSRRSAVASKISAQWPQRTQPSEILSWSATTLNIVPQTGQRVIRPMKGRF